MRARWAHTLVADEGSVPMILEWDLRRMRSREMAASSRYRMPLYCTYGQTLGKEDAAVCGVSVCLSVSLLVCPSVYLCLARTARYHR